jgi:hypothetical protein
MKRKPVLTPWAAALWVVCVALLANCAGKSNLLPASEIQKGEVTITWDEVPGAVSYNIYYGTSAGLTKWNCIKIPNVSKSVTLTDLAWGRAFFFGLSAATAAGEGNMLAEQAYTVQDRKGSVHLTIPGGPAPDSRAGRPQGGEGSSTLAWDSVPGAISYNVYLSESPGVTRQTGRKISAVSNSHTLTGLTPGTAYYLVITAVTEGGESRESEELSFTAK